eukprot:53722_1
MQPTTLQLISIFSTILIASYHVDGYYGSCRPCTHCLHYDIYPQIGSETSIEINIQNIKHEGSYLVKYNDSWQNNLYEIYITPRDNHCFEPSISFAFSSDYGDSSDYLDIFNGSYDSQRIARCNATGERPWCDPFTPCIHNQSLNISAIDPNITYQLTVYKSHDWMTLCGEWPNWIVINAMITFTCAGTITQPSSASYVPNPPIHHVVPCGVDSVTNGGKYCYYYPIYPEIGVETSITINIQNCQLQDLHYEIYITPHVNTCTKPRISFEFENTDFSVSYKFLEVWNGGYLVDKVSQCGEGQSCGTWHTCFSDYVLGINRIDPNHTHQIMIYKTPGVEKRTGCTYAINARLTFICSDETVDPTQSPTVIPTNIPSFTTRNPTHIPTVSPSRHPTSAPTINPTYAPTVSTNMPTSPSNDPTLSPSNMPTSYPSLFPSKIPTSSPSMEPTLSPSNIPSVLPTSSPSLFPSYVPTTSPSNIPTVSPTHPTLSSNIPTISPSNLPTRSPSNIPTVSPSRHPTSAPTINPTYAPTVSTNMPTSYPSLFPSKIPTSSPSMEPTLSPSNIPSVLPTSSPSLFPSYVPTTSPSNIPTVSPTHPTLSSNIPTISPSNLPTRSPSNIPSVSPSSIPTISPSNIPILSPINIPSLSPSNFPSVSPSNIPTSSPSLFPSNMPSLYLSSTLYDVKSDALPSQNWFQKMKEDSDFLFVAVMALLIIVCVCGIILLVMYMCVCAFKNRLAVIQHANHNYAMARHKPIPSDTHQEIAMTVLKTNTVTDCKGEEDVRLKSDYKGYS